MQFQRIIASDFEDGGSHLSFEFGKPAPKQEGEVVQVKCGYFITAGFPGGEGSNWTQKEVANQLRTLADHLEKTVNAEDEKRRLRRLRQEKLA